MQEATHNSASAEFAVVALRTASLMLLVATREANLTLQKKRK